jgi:hypothetical protein
MKYTKKCPNCNKTQSYSRLGNYNRAIKHNTLCKKCTHSIPNESRNMKISNALKGKPKSKDSIEKMKKSLKKLWESKTDEEMNCWREIVSNTSKLRWQDDEYRNRVANSVSQHWNSMSDEDRTKRFHNQQKGGAGRCKYYKVGDYTVYGMVEKRYIREQYKLNSEMPLIKTREGINTPYGMVFIDFEYNSFFVEIKSTYTYSILIEESDLDNSQLKKILWVNDNVKPVKILVETERRVFTDYTNEAILPFIGNQRICEYSGLLKVEEYT